MTSDDLKAAAGRAAVDYIKPLLNDTSIIGVGTGSTANCFIDALAHTRPTFKGAVASSEATAERLQRHGITVYDLNEAGRLSVYIDGADECDHQLHLIKGGGGALTREKIVAACANEFICIADESKYLQQLGKFPLPIEVIPMASHYVASVMTHLGGNPIHRAGTITDNGNHIIDVHDLIIDAPKNLENTINQIVGVVTNGLFAARKADTLLLATKNGVNKIKGE